MPKAKNPPGSGALWWQPIEREAVGHADRRRLGALRPTAQALPSRLDDATNNGEPWEKGTAQPWRVIVYREAGEVVAVRAVAPKERAKPDPTAPVDEVRSAKEAGRRAACKMRRYGASNGLSRLATLTFAVPCYEYDEAMSALDGFRRRLATTCGRQPWMWALERHKSGAFHVHVAFGRYIPKRELAEAWRLGFVDILLIRDRTGQRLHPSKAAKVAARYLAKYVSKSLDERTVPKGRKRYEVARGFDPEPLEAACETVGEVMSIARQVMGGGARFVWASRDDDSWRGPPTIVAFY